MQETNVVTWMHGSELYRYDHWKRTPNIPRHSKWGNMKKPKSSFYIKLGVTQKFF